MSKTDEIRNEIIEMIRLGIISPGEKLPSIRKTAKKYEVSITPVSDAYNSLVAQQLVESRPQSGYFVTSSIENLQKMLDLQLHVGLNKSEHYSMVDDFFAGYSEIAFNVNNDIRFSYGSTSATSSIYPEMNFNACLAECVHDLKDAGNRQVKLHDELPLKKSIMKWMQPCFCKQTMDDISIVGSVTEGVMLAIRACSSRGGLVAIEAPGHVGFYFIAKYLEREVLSVPSTPERGIDIDVFELYLRQGIKPSCLILSSVISNPTGAVMPDENKKRLVELCAKFSVPIIEDDILGELYFTDSRPRPLKSFDSDNVIYVSGFGKCLAPTIRLAYVSPGRYKKAFAFYKHISTSYAYPPIQLAMSEYLDRGTAYKDISFFRKWLKTCVLSYRDEILASFPSGTSVNEPQGGPYLWVTLPEGCSANELCEKAKRAGITIAPSHLFNAKDTMYNCFRFNCAALPFDSVSLDAVKKLGSLAHSLIND